jgi:hypothetical protein
VQLTGLGPRAGVAVSLDGPESLATVTDASGRYAFDGLSGGDYAVTATVPSTVELQQTVSVRAERGGPAARASDLVFTPIATIAGTVILSGLDPQPALTVTISGPVSEVVVADSVGGYRVGPVPPGDYLVSVDDPYTAEGSASTTVHVTIGSVDAPGLFLTPRGALTGFVVLDGLEPPSGVTVAIDGPVLLTTVTDASGRFVFDGLPLGGYTLTATVPSTAEGSRTTAVEVSFGAGSVPELSFTPVGALTGVVVVAGADPQPVLTVTISGPVSATTSTGTGGAYAFGALPPGDYVVAVAEPYSLEGTASATVHLAMGATTAPDLRLTARGALTGRVVLSGLEPQAGLVVSAQGPAAASTTTDAFGTFSFRSLPPGDYVVIATVPFTAEGEQTALVHVGLGVGAVPDLVFTPVGWVYGTVTLTGVSPQPGLAVAAFGPANVSTVAGPSGAYALGPLPLGRYVVSVSEPSSLEGVVSATVDVEMGTTTAPALRLTPTGGVSGRIVLRNAPPQAGLTVALQFTAGVTWRVASTDATGAYTFDHVPLWDWKISATLPSTAEATTSVPISVSFGSTTTVPDLVFTPLGAVQGAVSLADPAGAASGAVVWAQGTSRATRTDGNGAYTLQRIPVGSYTVSASLVGYQSAADTV